MKTSRAAAATGLTVRALRYYETQGLVVPVRHRNGYRDYQPEDVRLLQELKSLIGLGLSVRQTRPFLMCVSSGHARADDCPASLAAYREAITELDVRIGELTAKRAALVSALGTAATRGFDPIAERRTSMSPEPSALPEKLPAPTDDGAADHLAGRAFPPLALTATSGETISLERLGAGRTVLYFYPLTGRPGVDLPEGWDTIPGARGCTAQACDFRDHHSELRAEGVGAVYGISAQDTQYQREVVDRLRLPFSMLADPRLSVAEALNLPTFRPADQRLYKRLTLMVRDGRIEHVFYPVFPPNEHAARVLGWLRAHPVADNSRS